MELFLTGPMTGLAPGRLRFGKLATAGQKNMNICREYGAPGKIRTPNPQIRSLVLYPIELRALRQGARV